MHDIRIQTEVTYANLGRNTDMTPIKSKKTTTISTKLIAFHQKRKRTVEMPEMQ
jgi:hypothetical protein